MNAYTGETEMTLRAQLAAVNAEIVKAKAAEKIGKKLAATRISHKTAHKYYALQELYQATVSSKTL